MPSPVTFLPLIVVYQPDTFSQGVTRVSPGCHQGVTRPHFCTQKRSTARLRNSHPKRVHVPPRESTQLASKKYMYRGHTYTLSVPDLYSFNYFLHQFSCAFSQLFANTSINRFFPKNCWIVKKFSELFFYICNKRSQGGACLCNKSGALSHEKTPLLLTVIVPLEKKML